jgi:ubiquitin-like 1-activating enzyme E1 A
MRTARILVVGLRGVATEVIKNLVLAGIGSLVMADNQDVKEEDLGSGFFYRDEDVGKKVRDTGRVAYALALTRLFKRVYAAKARVEALNPLVTVEAVPLSQTPEVEVEQLSKMIQGVDLVCITDHPRDTLVSFV